MKANKGITLISLTIYIIILMLVIATLNVFANHFFDNLSQVVVTQNVEEEHSELIAYLTTDIKSDKLNYIKTGELGKKQYLIVKFTDNTEHQYIFQNSNIYYLDVNKETPKKIKLCGKVTAEDKVFNYENSILTVKFAMNGTDFQNFFNVADGN